MYEEVPIIIQIRQNCLIAYNDYSYLPKKIKEKKEQKQITRTNTFSSGSKKRMKKILDLWHYSLKQEEKINFITLTLSSNWKKNIKYETYIKNFIENIKYKIGSFNYIYKAEFQDNGNLHYHILIDKNIHWKIVRSTWNKIQKVHVDDYQMKMKNKYKNGYYLDKNMCYKNGEMVNEEVQKKRYQIGKKANWRNPNSTDLKEIDDKKMIGNYINKYMNKQDNVDENNNQKNTPIKSYWGKNQELECLRYGTVYENQLTDTTRILIVINTIKKIEENSKTICTIHNKINEADISEIENEALKINQSILKNVRENKIQENTQNQIKELKKYNKLYEENLEDKSEEIF